MRIYKSDGSYTENPFDTEFGWNLQEITVDEAVPDYLERNRNLRKSAALGDRTVNYNLENSIESSYVVVDNPKRTTLIEKIEPQIKIVKAISILEPTVENAGLVTIFEEEEESKLENIDKKIPSKQQMASLINPCSVESKILLSVIHFAKHKNLVKDIINLGDIRSSSKIKFLISQKSEDIEDNLRSEINNYHATKEDNMLSLMMELILRDTNSEMTEITDCDKHEQNLDSSDLGNSILSESDNATSQEFSSLSRLENCNRSEFLSSIGLSDAIDRSLQKICEETYDVHLNISELKKSFMQEEIKVNALIEESQVFERHLRETKFLDDLINLLNGRLDKISLKKSPFRIFTSSSNTDEQNLII